MSTRRTMYLALVAALVAAVPAMAAPAKAAHKKAVPPRVITITYSQPCSVYLAPTGGDGAAQCPGDQTFTAAKGEKVASIQVTDASGQPAVVAFGVDATGVSSDVPTMICGSASGLSVAAGTTYSVHPAFNVGDTGCPAPPTSGTVKITLASK